MLPRSTVKTLLMAATGLILVGFVVGQVVGNRIIYSWRGKSM
jgi:hypothetical protein